MASSVIPSALTVDLEEYFQVSNFERRIPRERWPALPSRLDGPTRRLLDLFDRYRARATFFVLGWVAERHGALLREIARRGHEIGCHGQAHALVYDLGSARFRADLRRARAAIEDALGEPVRAYRAASYSITERSLWALEILAEEGFRDDSSIFPIRHPRYGLPQFPRHAVALELGRGLRLREFPPTTLRLGRWNLPWAGGAYLRFLPARLFRWGFARAARERPPALLYLHPWELDPDQPRVPAGWRIRINHYHNLGRTAQRLEALLARIRFVPLGEALDRTEAAGRLPSHRLAELVSPQKFAGVRHFSGQSGTI